MLKLISILILLLVTAVARSEIITVGGCVFAVEPQPCNTTYLQFFLFTRSGGSGGEIVAFTENWDNLTSSQFDQARQNKVIIHGFNADMNLYALQDIKDGYLKQGDYNVWMLNWSPLVTGYCYPAALHNVAYAGKCLAHAIQRLRSATSGELQLHVIGFSLGAHVPGAAARLIKPYLIPRVTGLDPAGPGFYDVEAKERISDRTGKFVDIIHTNGLMQGLLNPLGHVDFYMNGGITQPGCYKNSILDWLNCDHVRAPVYFAESILSKTGFYGWQCNHVFYIVALCRRTGKTPVLAGEHVDQSTRGTYVIQTNSNSPYAKGKW